MSRFEASLDDARGKARRILSTVSSLASVIGHSATLPMKRPHAHATPGKDPGHAHQA